MTILIHNARIINEGESFVGSVLLEDSFIRKIWKGKLTETPRVDRTIEADGLWLLPGAIDDHVHFRDPGLTYKGDLSSESGAAVAGGVTSFMDMPNTIPQTTTKEALETKFELAAEKSHANYSFWPGGTNDNFEFVSQLDLHRTPGIKVFMGSSTGNMLVDKQTTKEKFFGLTDHIIAIHSEKESIIRHNREQLIKKYGEDPALSFHPFLRSEEACYTATAEALELATRLNTKLHICHLSTARELTLLNTTLPLEEKRITAETCPLYLWFTDADYAQFGHRMKCNPAVKTAADRAALRQAIANDTIDLIATDHAPHLQKEKQGGCIKAASGAPSVQHSLTVLLELAWEKFFTVEQVVKKMAHAPALRYGIDRRGFIREGYFADLVLVSPNETTTVGPENVHYKCGWSPFDGYTFHHVIKETFVNGQSAYAQGQINKTLKGSELVFNS